MDTLSDLVPRLAPGFRGCPKFTVIDALIQAARRLCTEGLIWRERMAPIHISAGQESYAITPTIPGAFVIKPMKAWVGGRPITPITPDEAYDKYGQASFAVTGSPEHYCATHSGMLDLYPVPSAALANGLTVIVALSLTPDATTVPDWIAMRHADTLVKGARAILSLLPGEPWSNDQQAGVWEQRFMDDVNAARLDAERGNTRARRRVVSHFY